MKFPLCISGVLLSAALVPVSSAQTPAPGRENAASGMWAGLPEASLTRLKQLAVASWKKAGSPKRPDFVMEGAMFHEGKWYARVEKAVTWKDAQAACAAAKGRLVVVHDAATWAFVELAGGPGWFWMGATDEAKPGEWRWVDGKPMTFSLWATRQPDNNKGDESFLHAGFQGKWNDLRDSGRDGDRQVTHYLCEWGESAARPATTTTDQSGMTLGADWMPRLGERRELLTELEYYSRFAVAETREKDVKPRVLTQNLTWLMPLDEAVRSLPAGVNRFPERKIAGFCLPENSFTLHGFQFRHFNDDLQTFNQIWLMADKDRKLVGVQLVNENKGLQVRPKGTKVSPDSAPRHQYSDTLNVKTGGCSHWVYRDPGRPGVVIVETLNRDGIRWYLAAPVARLIVDIAAKNREAGFLR